MSRVREICIVFPGGIERPVHSTQRVVHSREARSWLGSGELFRHLLRYRGATGLVGQTDFIPQALLIYVFLRLLSHGRCWLEMPGGRRERLGIRYGARRIRRFLSDLVSRRRLLKELEDDVARRLERQVIDRHAMLPRGARRALYLRTDLWFGITAGGSIGHIAGVVNQLQASGWRPLMLTTDRIPTVDPGVETEVVLPDDRFVDFRELPALAFNRRLHERIARHPQRDELAFIYQRYGTGNYVGCLCAETLVIPLVLEYNGSEVWISGNWGSGLAYPELSERIETLNLLRADLVVVVSGVLRDELISRGVSSERILVNPNGVEPESYHPDVDGRKIRDRYAFGDSPVIGFIGTFGPWHGAEVLVDAFVELHRRRSDLDARLMMVGDGAGMAAIRARITSAGISDRVALTGLVPQADGPAHLAACDVLVSPHVPNPDGSRFFGSPTKLFEYMAMGRAIVASNLEQIGEILVHEQMALLVPPSDVSATASACIRLIEQPELRQRLALAARKQAVERHSWAAHTQRIVEALDQQCRIGNPG